MVKTNSFLQQKISERAIIKCVPRQEGVKSQQEDKLLPLTAIRSITSPNRLLLDLTAYKAPFDTIYCSESPSSAYKDGLSVRDAIW